MTPTMGSLFAGIGGFDLGFERAGFKTSWQVEIDPYCQKVLAKNFPEAKRFGDIRECGIHNLRPVDVICGGFPCQDISSAGQRAGITGPKSSLWGEYRRIIAELRPRFVVIENVADLVIRGLDVVLSDLAALGFDADWTCVTAAGFNAPHIRERFFLVGYPHELGLSIGNALAMGGSSLSAGPRELHPWEENKAQPDVSGMAHGIPKRVDRVKCLGNSVVPQISEMIAWRIKQVLEAA